jgi:tetratricopeptide (TPR) repeat protein
MRYRNIQVFSALVLLAGCASAPLAPQFDPEEYARLLDQRQFANARILLLDAPAEQLNEGQRRALGEQLDLAGELYVEDLLNSAAEQERQQRWYQAGQYYREGIDALPHNTALLEAYEGYLAQQQGYMNEVHGQLKLHRAKLLPREIELTHLLVSADPRNQQLQNSLYDMELEAASLVSFLTPLAQQAYDEGNFPQARIYDEQILQLGESAQSRQRIAVIDARQNREAQRVAQGRQQADKKKHDVLLRNYDEAMQQADYLQARETLRQLDALGFDGPVAHGERERLEGLINAASTRLVAEGKKFYTRGKLDSAIDSWRKALVFNPDNPDLVGRIKRAETFQANYQRLAR